MSPEVERLKELIDNSDNIVFFGGAGVSTESNIPDFKRHSKTRFRQDSFIEHIEFDYLEIQVIEED